jgi:uncharacterized protein (TIGR04255 family)
MKKKARRKTFKNPQIVEAVIELRFATPIDNGKIQNKLNSQYDCKREELVSFTAQLSQENMSVSRNQTGQFRLRFLIKEQHVSALVYPDRISFHWHGNYPGWDVFQPAFSNFWSKFTKVYPDVCGNRVGVRFINMVTKKTIDQDVGHWLKLSADYPKGLLSAKSDYFYSLRRLLKSGRNIQLFVAEGESKDGKSRPLILDIDILQDIDNKKNSQKELLETIDSTHDEVVKIFESSITQNYTNLLNKKVD